VQNRANKRPDKDFGNILLRC